jgi:hypothetical protein
MAADCPACTTVPTDAALAAEAGPNLFFVRQLPRQDVLAEFKCSFHVQSGVELHRVDDVSRAKKSTKLREPSA